MKYTKYTEELIDTMLEKYNPNISQEVIDATTDPELKAFYKLLETTPLEVIKAALKRRAIEAINSYVSPEDKLAQVPDERLVATLEDIKSKEEGDCKGCGISTKEFKKMVENELNRRGSLI